MWLEDSQEWWFQRCMKYPGKLQTEPWCFICIKEGILHLIYYDHIPSLSSSIIDGWNPSKTISTEFIDSNDYKTFNGMSGL